MALDKRQRAPPGAVNGNVRRPAPSFPRRNRTSHNGGFDRSARMGTFHDELRAFSAAIGRELEERELGFPTVLDLSLRIRRVASDPDSTIGDLARLVQLEPVLSARIVRTANSVVFSPIGRAVSGVPEAVQRLGMSNVRVTALVVAMDQLAQEHRTKTMRDLARATWAHSVDVGAWAFALARELRVASPDTALLAGLMADVGVLFLAARAGAYPTVAEDAGAFREIAQVWAAPVTRAIVDKLDLPPAVLEDVEAIDGYAAAWPPATLKDVLLVARLAADSSHPGDAGHAQWREQRRAELAASARDPGLDELLGAAASGREALLDVLKG